MKSRMERSRQDSDEGVAHKIRFVADTTSTSTEELRDNTLLTKLKHL